MILRVLSGLMVPVFGLAVAVQYNDPDPIGWMAIYGVAALAALLGATGRAAWPFPTLVAAAALGWAAVWFPKVRYSRQMWPGEEARELGGLLIVAFWMLVLAVAGVVRARRLARTKAKLKLS